jgi:hypothetical protein
LGKEFNDRKVPEGVLFGDSQWSRDETGRLKNGKPRKGKGPGGGEGRRERGGKRRRENDRACTLTQSSTRGHSGGWISEREREKREREGEREGERERERAKRKPVTQGRDESGRSQAPGKD